MKKIIAGAVLAMVFVGCSTPTEKEVIQTTTTVDSDSYVTLDSNQSIGYKPNTDVTIVNVGDGYYYVYCSEGECPVTFSEEAITDSNNDSSNSEVTENNYMDNNNS